jgi:hypothetical protein
MKLRVLFFVFALASLPSVVFSQKNIAKTKNKITIWGTVTDMNKKPMAGVEIFVDSARTNFTSDDQGKFKIVVSPKAINLLVISPGRGFGTADINGQTNINLTINRKIDDVPAFVYDGGTKKGSKTPAKPKKINTYTDIYQMIRQEVPGVVVSGRSIVVQGPNSFFGSTQPLFVVNGAIVRSIDDISPVEVKSIELLKGSYASKYGVEGANGVISITLFKGSDR